MSNFTKNTSYAGLSNKPYSVRKYGWLVGKYRRVSTA